MTEVPDWMWFEGETWHFDAPRYAAARGITVEEAMKELREMLADLLPAAQIRTDG